MNEETRYDLIDRYLRGDLEKGHPFLQQLQEDIDLQQEVATQRLVAEAVIDYRLMQVGSIVEGYRSKAIKPDKKFAKWLWWAMPAAFVAALVPFISQKESSPDVALLKEKREKAPILSPDQKVIPKKEIEAPNLVRKQPSVSALKASPQSAESRSLAENNTSLLPQAPLALQEEPHNISQPNMTNEMAKAEIKTEKSIPLPDPCASVHFKAFVHETRPCRGKNEGMLEIQQVRGGTSPYLYSIDMGKTYHKDALFKYLGQGKYGIYLKDDNGCEGTVNAHFALDAKTCVDLMQYSFNPHVETWDLPLAADKNGNITIVDRFGNQMYLRNFSQNERLTWNGDALNGQLLSAGTYVYTISYGDGTIERGNVTLAY